MSDALPTLEESTIAVVKAVAARRARYRGDPNRLGLTTAAIAGTRSHGATGAVTARATAAIPPAPNT